MKRLLNESPADRAIRVVLGVLFLWLGWAEVVTGGWGTFLKWFGFVPLLTGIFGFCPLYALFGFSTRKTEDADRQEKVRAA